MDLFTFKFSAAFLTGFLGIPISFASLRISFAGVGPSLRTSRRNSSAFLVKDGSLLSQGSDYDGILSSNEKKTDNSIMLG